MAHALEVTLDGASPGKVFDGVGATSASTSYLLYQYPEPQRSQVLDYLFKPHYGAALQILKIEVGGEGNSTIVSEPSHMPTASREDYQRGYELWLAKEALNRNPNIKIVALAWSFPHWVASEKSNLAIDSNKAATYLTRFVQGAKKVHGIDIYCMGAWNELQVGDESIKSLKRSLKAAGLKTKVCADDTFDWKIVDRMHKDPELRDAIDIVTNHYPKYNVRPAVQSRVRSWGKPIWSTEDGPWVEEWNSNGNFSGPFATILNRNYVDGRMTSTNIWALVTSYYDIGPILHAGLMRAQSPWSGFYEVKSPIWALAHTTQFTQPGWRYIDSGSGRIGAGSYVTLHHGADFSIIVETMRATRPESMTFTLTGGLSAATLNVWRSNATSQFQSIEPVQTTAGKFSYTFDPGSVYSLTTTTGQRKGDAAPPPDAAFPAPYHADFEQVPLGLTPPPLFAMTNGAYEIAMCPGGRAGHCMRQTLATYPVLWGNGKDSPWILPTKSIPPTATPALLGDLRWRDYRVSADVFIEQAGEASLIGRTTNIDGAGVFIGYRFRLYDDGRWLVHGDSRDEKPLATGRYKTSRRVWRHMELLMHGARLSGTIDGEPVFAVDDDAQGAGMAGVGTLWNRASFDNFTVEPIAADIPMISTPPVIAPKRPPEPVVDLFVPTPGNSKVVLNWKSVSQAAGYRLRWGEDAKKLDRTLDLFDVTSHSIDGLQNGKTYYFVMAAFNGKGEGDRSYVQKAVPGTD